MPPRLDNDGDLIVVAVDEPVEGHVEKRARAAYGLALARPCRCQRFAGKLPETLVHSLRSTFDIRNDDTNSLFVRYSGWQAKVCSGRLIYKPRNEPDALSPLICVPGRPVVGDKASTSRHV